MIDMPAAIFALAVSLMAAATSLLFFINSKSASRTSKNPRAAGKLVNVTQTEATANRDSPAAEVNMKSASQRVIMSSTKLIVDKSNDKKEV